MSSCSHPVWPGPARHDSLQTPLQKALPSLRWSQLVCILSPSALQTSSLFPSIQITKQTGHQPLKQAQLQPDQHKWSQSLGTIFPGLGPSSPTMCLLYFSCVFFFRVFFSSAAFFSFWSIAARSNHITCSFWNQLRIISKLWVFDPHCSYCFYSETYSFAYHSSNSVFNSQQLNRKLFQLLCKSSVLRSFKTRKKKKRMQKRKKL